MKVTDLGTGGRTFHVTMAKGDDVMAGLTEFAEKYHIKNGHFTALGALDRGVFGWTDVNGAGPEKPAAQ
jgi:predicted DNA-binding protein with PD1-like motif